MVIEINKDIDRYKESVVMGLTARQLIFSIASVLIGGSMVLLLYGYIGLTPSVYIAIPAVSPVALGGFYSFNGMDFYEFMRRKCSMLFANRPLVYVSTEGEEAIRKLRIEKAAEEKAEKRKERKRKQQETSLEKEKRTEKRNKRKKGTRI